MKWAPDHCTKKSALIEDVEVDAKMVEGVASVEVAGSKYVTVQRAVQRCV